MNRKEINVIPKCGCDAILPFALVYIFYIILHGHISPGGGFQGGVLMVAVVVLIYLGHGYETTTKALTLETFRVGEGIAVTVYVCIAMAGIAFAAQFCENFVFAYGETGDLVSSGTIAMMNITVGAKVLTGVAVLALSMVGLLVAADEEE